MRGSDAAKRVSKTCKWRREEEEDGEEEEEEEAEAGYSEDFGECTMSQCAAAAASDKQGKQWQDTKKNLRIRAGKTERFFIHSLFLGQIKILYKNV